MRDYLANEVRNIVLLGHSQAGKTAVVESCLYFTKVTDRMGKTVDGTSIMDYDQDEVKRGLSCYTSLAPVEWKNCKINFIDTPGYLDYEGEMQAGLSVGDSALIVVGAKEGVESGTEKAWKNVTKNHLPCIFFINKIDEEHASFENTYNQLRDKFGKTVIPFEVPIMDNGEVVGSVNVLRKKAWYYNDRENAKEVPDALKDLVDEYYNQIAEAIAMTDDDLMEKFFSGEEFDQHEVSKGLRIGVRNGEIRPVYCGSAIKQTGIERLMDLITEYFPSYAEKGRVEAYTPKGDIIHLETNENETMSAQVFKTVVDPFVGKLTYFRVYSGSATSGSYVLNATKNVRERFGRLVQMHANHRAEITEVYSGDIAAAVGLKATTTGDTLCDEKAPIILESMVFPEPVIQMSVEPKTKADSDKMGLALAKLAEEDPTFKTYTDEETGQTIIAGMGELHLDIIIDRLRREFKVEANVGAPQVAYRETIRQTAECEGKFVRQSGGRGQYGHVWIKFEPNEEGKGFEFVDAIVGGTVPREYIKPTQEGLEAALNNGLVWGYPVVDIKATLFDGSYHDVDSSEMAYKVAASLALKEAAKKCKPALLEPIMAVDVTAPSEYLGSVMGDITKRRGQIREQEEVGNAIKVKAFVPLSEMFGYSTDLRSFTQGRGNYVMQMDHYAEVPKSIAEEIAKKNTKE